MMLTLASSTVATALSGKLSLTSAKDTHYQYQLA